MSGELPNPDPEIESEILDSGPLSSPPPPKTISEQLERDFLSAEFLAGLFWSAMNSFRHDSILRPFPPFFLEDRAEGASTDGGRPEGEELKDIEGLRQVFGSLPTMTKIAKGKATLSTQQDQLLQWILNPKRFTVSSVDPSSFTSLVERVDTRSTSDPPTNLPRNPKCIFELKYNEECESKFHSITGDHGLMYAFHGSSVENFHSIVHNGLLNMFNKVSAFGEGTYLSTELGVCLNWSPSGPLRPGGILPPGGMLPQAASCVAMCEVVKHPSVMSRCQVGGEPSIQGQVPEKYFIVSNDEFIRIKYIFVFETQKPVVRTRSWIFQHKFVVVLVLYLVFLFCVGASQSKVMKRLVKRFQNYYFRS